MSSFGSIVGESEELVSDFEGGNNQQKSVSYKLLLMDSSINKLWTLRQMSRL